MELEGKKALVVGGSRGIGRAICLAYAKSGADVALIYRSREAEAMNVCQQIRHAGRTALAIQADVSVAAEVKNGVRLAAQALGGFDILVNCAGIFPKQEIGDIGEADWRRLIDTNLSSYFFAIQAALPFLRESARGGRIINLSSQAAEAGSVDGSHYCAAKAGVLGLTYALAKELGGQGITVNALMPGRINTDMIQYASEEKRAAWMRATPLGRFGDPEDVAGAAVFLASDAGGYITGTRINISGGCLMG